MKQQHLQDLPPEVRSKIYKKLNTESLLQFGESGTRFIPEILRVVPSKQNKLWFTSVKHGFCQWTKIMIALGFDVNAKDNGWTALRYAAREGHLDIVKLLIKADADVNVQNKYGWAALRDAVSEVHLDIMKELIKAGADVNAKDDDGWTALHYAVKKGYLDIIKELIKAGTNVNAKTDAGWTALHLAACRGYLGIVKELINKEADRNIKNNLGRTAYDVAQNLRIKTYLKFRV